MGILEVIFIWLGILKLVLPVVFVVNVYLAITCSNSWRDYGKDD